MSNDFQSLTRGQCLSNLFTYMIAFSHATEKLAKLNNEDPVRLRRSLVEAARDFYYTTPPEEVAQFITEKFPDLGEENPS